MATRYWNGTQWDTLRPFNVPMARDLELLYEWDEMHPGAPAYYPDLIAEANKNHRYSDNISESGEVAKLLIWKMAEWCGHLYPDARETCHYRINEYGKSVHRGEVAFPYDYWQSDKTLNHAYPVFIHQVRNHFDVRPLRKYHLRSQPPPSSTGPQTPPPPPPAPPPPTTPPPHTPPPPPKPSHAETRKRLEAIRQEAINKYARGK